MFPTHIVKIANTRLATTSRIAVTDVDHPVMQTGIPEDPKDVAQSVRSHLGLHGKQRLNFLAF